MGVRIFRGGELDEKFVGSVVVLGPKPTHMSGLVRGDLFVRERSLCDITGFVTGMLLSEPTGKAVLRGMVAKDVKSSGGDLEIYGFVQGDVLIEGNGKVYIDPKALVRGEVKGMTVPTPPITVAVASPVAKA